MTDLIPIKNFKEENDDEEDRLQVIKTLNSTNISDEEEDVKFI